MLKKHNGECISTLTRLDHTFSSIYLDIETTKKECQEIIDSLNKEYVIKSSIYNIPSYNWNDEKDSHYTIDLDILLPNDIYNDLLRKHNKSYISDSVKVDFFNFIKK